MTTPHRDDAERVLIGNEAGRYLAKMLREKIARLDGEFASVDEVKGIFADWATDLEAACASNDEEIARQQGVAEGRATRDAEVLAMVDSLRKVAPAMSPSEEAPYLLPVCTGCGYDSHDCPCGIEALHWNAALDALARKVRGEP